MRKLAKIPSQLLSKEFTEALHLNEQSFLILIPKTLLTSLDSDNLIFDLVIDKGKLSLIGPDVATSPRVSQSVVEESAT